MDTEVPHWVSTRGGVRLRREEDDRQVRQLIKENPGLSLRTMAENLGWIKTTGVATGQPNLMRVYKAIKRLRESGQLR